MKTFKNYIVEEAVFKEVIVSLLEASITKSSYGPGRQVVPRKKQISSLSSALGIEIDEKSIFTKTEPKDDAKEIQIGNGNSAEVYLEFKKNNFKLVGTGSSISNYFNHYKDTTGVSWKADSLETAQCIGLYIDGDKMLDDFGSAGGVPSVKLHDSYVKQIKKIFGNGQDWNQSGVAKIMEKLDKMPVADWFQLASLAAGMTSFKNDKVKRLIGGFNIIHGRITDYYRSEEENASTKGSKENTADIVISNVSASELIDGMSKHKVEYDKNGVCTLVDSKIKFLQVSLKKARGGAQLGKITGLLQSKYDLPAYDVMLNTMIEEGFLSKIGKFMSSIVDKLKNVLNKIKKWARGIYNKISKRFDVQVKKDLAFLEKKMGLKRGHLKECFKYDENGMICEGLNDQLSKLSQKNINILRRSINERLADFEKTANKMSEFIYHKSGNLTKGDISADSIFKLFSNYTAVYVFNEVISSSDGDMNKLKNEIIDLQKEMFFGKTLLPIYKVYGVSSPNEKSYDYLGGAREFSDKKRNDIGGVTLPISGFHASSIKTKEYYALESSFVMGVDDDGNPTYSLNRMGSNAGSEKFSFVFEGSSVIDVNTFKRKYGN
jgi:hypothetical protein